MNLDQREDIALFRYELIQPVISGTYPQETKTAYYNEVAEREILFPDGKTRRVRPGTLKEWVTNYKKHGIKGLMPKGRADKGNHRSLTTEQKEEILRLKMENPRRTGTSIHKRLIRAGFYPDGIPSVSTVQRYLASQKDKIPNQTREDRRAFEMKHVADLWQIDTTHGPYLTINGKKKKVYVVSIIDDASRLTVGFGLYFSDNAVNVQETLKRAIQTYGKPRRLFTDNGGPYINKQLKMICATLGIGINRAAPYHGNQKGKIERSFGVMKQQWMYDIDYSDFDSLEALEKSYHQYVIDRNNQVNRMIGMTPIERFSREPEAIHKVPQWLLDQAFLHQETRKVGNDGTISLFGKQYETDYSMIGRTIVIRYQPDCSEIFMEINDTLTPIHLVNKIENGRTPRKQIRMTEVNS